MSDFVEYHESFEIPDREKILSVMIYFHEDGLIDNVQDESELVDYVILREFEDEL
jgi:hypothetical protein